MINPSDILGNDSHGQGSMTPPQVSSRLRLLKKKVKRKESFSNGYDDQNVSSGNYNNVGSDNYSQYQQPANYGQPARRSQHQRVQQQGWSGSNDISRSSSGQVNYGADHEDPFGQNSQTLSYHDIDNQPLGGGGGGGYNPNSMTLMMDRMYRECTYTKFTASQPIPAAQAATPKTTKTNAKTTSYVQYRTRTQMISAIQPVACSI